jgi:small subunit ribosomal protein S3
MGQKVNPVGFRVGITRPWESKWYAEKDFQRFLHEDIAIRKFLKEKLYVAGISKIRIERAANKAKVYIHAAKPGVIIDKRARGLDALRADLQGLVATEVFLNVMEVRKVDADALLVAENVAAQLEKRVSFRRAMKKAITQAKKSGAKGVKVMCAGRLGGSEMSRTEWYRDGRVPLHTLRADVDYGLAEAKTTYGTIGVKVWIYRGEFTAAEDERSI